LWYLGKRWLADPRLGCAYYNWVLFGIGLGVFARLLRGLLPPEATRRFLLILSAGSMFTYHVQAYYGEVFTAVLVGAGVLSVCTRRSAWLGWTAIRAPARMTRGPVSWRRCILIACFVHPLA
ncbi:MAG: hypothetical protein M3O50_12780, partial [Myxococcota bacterium]|nr:hypothetical protein [Myxococcota bacterium]